MSIKLPIVISAEQKVSELFDLSTGMLEKLEAWANFETLKANWYGDEDIELKCQFTLVSADTFQQKFASLDMPEWKIDNENNAALKFGGIEEKQHIILDMENQHYGDIADKSRWLSNDIQLQLQILLRHWLNQIARQYQLDVLDD
ncbi:hypothetical protein HII17_01605 [Thalassotalea sp. M1531]|uniref:Uncharacterized protein n=1 Tax=Thalassotalea algicola TaxID=2716224 RepID=A0A7Y0Q5E9_9GAMM|nr:hypothetical protein [Thalassotalea algicola]NMP30243.1 hypothetical protein [Thalassotalea algicola]